jgi:lipopolysaccharide export system protein LptA
MVSSMPLWIRFPSLLCGVSVALTLCLAPKAVAGQVGGDCDVPDHSGFVTVSLSNGSRITYFRAPTIVCSGGTRIRADSAVVYEATDYTQLFRNVVFSDSDSRLTANQAQYFDQEKRLRAWGNVVLNDLAEGSIIRGDTMVLLRAGPGRAEDQLTVLGRRPHATLYPTLQPVAPDTAEGEAGEPSEGVPADPEEERTPPDTSGAAAPDSLGVAADSAGVAPDTTVAEPDPAGVVSDTAAVPADPPGVSPPPGPEEVQPPPLEERTPYEVRARRMFLEGSQYFRATGSVTINRDSVDAEADSLDYDQALGALFLANNARLTTAAYDLSATTIRLDIPQDEIRTVLAREEALLDGEDLWLLAPLISLALTDGKVDRLVAFQPPPPEDSTALEEERPRRRVPQELMELGLDRFPTRPHAVAQDYLLRADSIEVLAPDEVLDEVWAMGSARGESLARDSLNTEETPPLIERDWLEGDTIVAIFVPQDDSSAVQSEGVETVQVVAPPSAGGEAPADSARYRLDRLVARVGARSLYRLAATDSAVAEEEGRLAIHYVIGDEITILMSEGEVDRMEVTGTTRGIHLEPVATRRRDIPPDTTAVQRGGASGGGR